MNFLPQENVVQPDSFNFFLRCRTLDNGIVYNAHEHCIMLKMIGKKVHAKSNYNYNIFSCIQYI